MKKSRLLILFLIVTVLLFFSTAAIIDRCSIFSGLQVEEAVEDTEPEKEITEEIDKDESEDAKEEVEAEEKEEADETIDVVQPEEEAELIEESPERDNQPPEVTDIIFSSIFIFPNNTYDVTAIASDPDGDDLYYEWGVSDGTIAEWEGWDLDSMKWTTPDEEVTVAVTVRVYDGNGGTNALTEDVGVMFQQVEVEMEDTGTETQMEMQALFTMEFPLVESESGNIRFGDIPDKISDDWAFGTGDTRRNQHMKCFASYDISGFQGGEIKNVVLTLKYIRHTGISFWDNFEIYSASWGPRALQSSDYHLIGSLLKSYPISSPGDIVCDVPLLKQKLLEAIERGDTRFQIMFFLSPALSNNNDLNDGWTIGTDSSLKINYIP